MTINSPAPTKLEKLFRGFGIFVLFVTLSVGFVYLTACTQGSF